MALLQFAVTGEQISNDETEEVIREAEPHRVSCAFAPMAASCSSIRE